MKSDYFLEFSKYEDSLLERYSQHPLFLNIHKFSDEEFINILTQYGEGISANFVKFVETALRQIRNPIAREAMLNILRDEIPQSGPTHQQMRTDSMSKIGVVPEKLVATQLTVITQKTVSTYFDIICSPIRKWKNRDLGITVFVRVIGESLVGVVYKVFTQEIMRRFNLTEEDIAFYSFHWHHDEKGGTPVQGEKGHTEYYDLALKDLIKTEENLAEAIEMADLALKVRNDFQNQFTAQSYL